MDEFRQNNRLRGALDAALSGLNGDPALAQRVLRCAEEKPRAANKNAALANVGSKSPLRVAKRMAAKVKASALMLIVKKEAKSAKPPMCAINK